MKIRELAPKEVDTASLDAKLSEIAAMKKRHGVGVVPVTLDGKLESFQQWPAGGDSTQNINTVVATPSWAERLS